jgi:hypothetical protein
MSLPYGIQLGAGITVGAGISIGSNGAGSPADPATNTGGISLSVIAGLPQNLYPAVSVYNSGVQNAQFIINPASTYGTPSGFTFLNNWDWTQFDPTYISVTTTTNTDDTATALYGNANNAVLGSVQIAPGTKRMFSVTHTVWSGAPGYDGVGVGSSSTDYTGYGKYLGSDNQAIGIYDDGQVFINNASVASGYAVFETNGQIIDVAVDTVNYKMWYRVAGGAWQG